MAAASTSSLVMVESMAGSISTDDDGRIVRFDSECVLIPEYHSSSTRRPRVVTKSYSLPLWKRRSPVIPSHDTDDSPDTILSSSPEDTHVVIRVPIPSFVRRPPRSPVPTPRSPSFSPTLPLSPCLVHRPPSTEINSPRKPTTPQFQSPTTRRPSLPIYQRKPDDQTVPLRACCLDCVPITDQCLKEGEGWKEKFTKGAKRRRSASLDSTPSASVAALSIAGSPPGTSRLAGASKTAAFIPASFDARMPVPIAITVDEVDKRRRSQDLSAIGDIRSASPQHRVIHRSTSATLPLRSIHDRDHSSSSTCLTTPRSQPSSSSSSSSTSQKPQSLGVITDPLSQQQRKSSPIAEEDENELFPLPSPRRSPTGSRSSSVGSSPRHSPNSTPLSGPTPNGSSACLHPNSASSQRLGKVKKERSNDSVSSEELLKDTFSRRNGSGNVTRAPTMTVEKPEHLTLSFPIPIPTNGTGGDTVPNSPAEEEERYRIPSSSFSFSSISSKSNNSTTPTTTSPRLPTSPKNGNKKLIFPFKSVGVVDTVLRGVSSISGGHGGV